MGASSLQQEIKDADRTFERTFGQHDADGMAALYTQDGQLLPPGTEVVSGHEDIAAFWQRIFDGGCERRIGNR